MNPPSLPQTRIGIDLDNTLIRYDAAFHACARQLKWITPDVAPTKQAIRDHLRTLPDGEHRWTELQSRVYGPQILSADLAPGADRFLRLCHVNRIPVVIVSHKSRRAAFDPSID
ncbi:MAG: hypothetical protein O3B24_11330, partial [Verrucomicrobia bacterium]|nr:hypothetical protein [Verrucomicrobiota bacterium]